MAHRALIFIISVIVWFQGTRIVIAADPIDKSVYGGVLHSGLLLILYDDGTFGAWNLKTSEYVKEEAVLHSRKGLNRLAADADYLWVADDTSVYCWNSTSPGWVRKAGFDGDGEVSAGMAVISGKPYVVFPSKVVDPIGNRTLKPQKLQGYAMLLGPPFKVLTTHGTNSTLWIGVGRGEWGGALFGLDVNASTWVTSSDSAKYVTGITHTPRNEVVTSWSMSHFSASTMIRVHKTDATTKTEYSALNDKYYQCIAYNTFDEVLYAMESTNLVEIRDGKPTKLAALDGRLYESEPNAIGISPGIMAILPIARREVVIVPKRGEPWLFRDGRLTKLVKP